MPDLFFTVMWLIPLLMMVVILKRFAEHFRLIQKHLQNPEALAEAVRKAAESARDGDEFDSDAIVVELLQREENTPLFRSGAARSDRTRSESQTPTPYGEAESSGLVLWLALAVIAGAAFAVWGAQ